MKEADYAEEAARLVAQVVITIQEQFPGAQDVVLLLRKNSGTAQEPKYGYCMGSSLDSIETRKILQAALDASASRAEGGHSPEDN